MSEYKRNIKQSRVGIKTENLKKTNKNRFFLKNRFLSGFFSNFGFFQNLCASNEKNILIL